MRRKAQQLTDQQARAVLARGTAGVLSVLGDGDYPYGVPMSYVYHGGTIYFHSALSGHKVDAILRQPKASFTVIDQDQVVAAEYTTYYRSVVAFGTARVLEDPAEKLAAIRLLAAKYAPDLPEGREAEIQSSLPRFCMIALEVQHLTGKEAVELARP